MSREPAHGVTAPQVAGYDADTGELVAQALGVEPCFVTPSWTEITAGKLSDRWDIAFGSDALTADRLTRLWMTAPYPDADATKGHGGDTHLADVFAIEGADDPDETRNGLSAVAAKYKGLEVAAVLEPRRRGLLRGPRPAPLAREPQSDPLTARVRRALLQRALPRPPGATSRSTPATSATRATSSPAGARTSRTRSRD